MAVAITEENGGNFSLTRRYLSPFVVEFRDGSDPFAEDPADMGCMEKVGRRFVAEIGFCALWLIAMAEHVTRFVLCTALAPIMFLFQLIVCDFDIGPKPLELLEMGLFWAPVAVLDQTMLTIVLLVANIFADEMVDEGHYLTFEWAKW